MFTELQTLVQPRAVFDDKAEILLMTYSYFADLSTHVWGTASAVSAPMRRFVALSYRAAIVNMWRSGVTPHPATAQIRLLPHSQCSARRLLPACTSSLWKLRAAYHAAHCCRKGVMLPHSGSSFSALSFLPTSTLNVDGQLTTAKLRAYLLMSRNAAVT